MACFDIMTFCCLCCSGSLETYCETKRFGAGGCCSSDAPGSAGCCGACCDKSFNEDVFDKQIKDSLARTRAADPPAVSRQPAPTECMEQLGKNGTSGEIEEVIKPG